MQRAERLRQRRQAQPRARRRGQQLGRPGREHRERRRPDRRQRSPLDALDVGVARAQAQARPVGAAASSAVTLLGCTISRVPSAAVRSGPASATPLPFTNAFAIEAMRPEPARPHARPILVDDDVEQPARKDMQPPDRPAHQHDGAVRDVAQRRDRRDAAEIVVAARQPHQQIAPVTMPRAARRAAVTGPAPRKDAIGASIVDRQLATVRRPTLSACK